MVKGTEKEGSGLLWVGMPSALTAGKRVPFSGSLYQIRALGGTKGTTKHRCFT